MGRMKHICKNCVNWKTEYRPDWCQATNTLTKEDHQCDCKEFMSEAQEEREYEYEMWSKAMADD
jgi:hypothetical protein